MDRLDVPPERLARGMNEHQPSIPDAEDDHDDAMRLQLAAAVCAKEGHAVRVEGINWAR